MMLIMNQILGKIKHLWQMVLIEMVAEQSFRSPLIPISSDYFSPPIFPLYGEILKDDQEERHGKRSNFKFVEVRFFVSHLSL